MAGSPRTGGARAAGRPAGAGASVLDRYFRITERGSTPGREVRGGFATFFTMAYIVVLNPLILAGARTRAATR